MKVSNFFKTLYEMGRKTSIPKIKPRGRVLRRFLRPENAPRSIRSLFWITIDRTRFTNAYFVAFHPLKKTMVQSWLGLSSSQKKKKIKLSDLTYRRTLRLFLKTLHQKLRGKRKWPTALRFEGSFTFFQIRETLELLGKIKAIDLVLIRNVTALHPFSGIRFKKQRRI